MLKNGVPGAPGVSQVPKTPKRCQKGAKRQTNSPLLKSFLDTCSALFFFQGLRDAKKGGPGARSKINLFFGGFRGLPGGPQEGSRLDGSSMFTFTAGAKKGSKMRAKMELFGLPNPHYTHFGAPFGRNLGPKSCIKKSVQNLGGWGAATSVSNWALDPFKDIARHPAPLQIRINIEH